MIRTIEGLLGIRDKAYQEECLLNFLALGWDPEGLHRRS